MRGRRVYEDLSGYLLKPGEYGRHNNGTWLADTPNGLGANLAAHEVTEHADGAITVSPSILVRGAPGESWHGYLEAGVWRECS